MRTARSVHVRLVAVLTGAVCFAVLSLVAAPGSAGSRSQSRPWDVDPALLQPLLVRGETAFAASGSGLDLSRFDLPAGLDRVNSAGGVAAGRLPTLLQPPVLGPAVPSIVDFPDPTTRDSLVPAGDAAPLAAPPIRPQVAQPNPVAKQVTVVRGIASWYDNGTTAMRWPRGATVRVCGQGGCVTRIVNDWGPDGRLYPDRIVDLMPADFATVCGCSVRRGLTSVTVEIFP